VNGANRVDFDKNMPPATPKRRKASNLQFKHPEAAKKLADLLERHLSRFSAEEQEAMQSKVRAAMGQAARN